MRHIKVAGVQTGAATEDVAENVARALRLLERAGEDHELDFVVFNELFNSRFFAVGQLERLAHPFDSAPAKATAALVAAAAKAHVKIVAGIAEKSPGGHYYNSA